jgi:dimeric dUTPase (all-alpha-NTP-PPase superfamily)
MIANVQEMCIKYENCYPKGWATNKTKYEEFYRGLYKFFIHMTEMLTEDNKKIEKGWVCETVMQEQKT